MLALGLAILAASACSPPNRTFQTVSWKEAPENSRRVLVVINQISSESRQIGAHYVSKRRIPATNVVFVSLAAGDEVSAKEFKEALEEPVRKKIRAMPQKPDFIVTTKGIPLRFSEVPGYSVDAHLACMDMGFEPMRTPNAEQIKRCLSPYYGKQERFSSKKFGFYLVARLDGYSVDQAKSLVDRSLAAGASKGPFLLDADPAKTAGGYKATHDALMRAVARLREKAFEVTLDDTKSFVSSTRELAGYASWGSNDQNFSRATYRSLRFAPGAIAETFVSTSARTFSPASSGQSLIADLIESGVTGAKGYVSEPYTLALAQADILFDRYTAGYTLAESFAMASPLLKWKDLVIGDPLCAPYAPK
jgi:uncharacterized protein (TIGR03790 family)